MPHWLAAVTALALRPASSSSVDVARPAPSPDLIAPRRAELATVLAGMVLACAGEEGARR